MNRMTVSSWRFKRFERFCIAVNSNDVISVGNQKSFNALIYISQQEMDFIQKYAEVDGSYDNEKQADSEDEDLAVRNNFDNDVIDE